MKTLLLFVSLMLAAMAQSAPAGARPVFEFELKDGSEMWVTPIAVSLQLKSRHAGLLEIDWNKIKQVEMKGGSMAVVMLRGGDRLNAEIVPKALEVESVLGRVQVPLESILKMGAAGPAGPLDNVALGKPVHGKDGASHGKGLAKHVTDGDPTTHAKPPGSNFDYRVDLQNGADATFSIRRIVINWGRFGDQFVGVRAKGGEGWAPAAWPGEYVTSYTLECRKAGNANWEMVHQFNGRPVDEKGDGVEVIKRPTKEAGCSSESTTILKDLDLRGVAELRVRARGGHWIGLFELEAHGHQE